MVSNTKVNGYYIHCPQDMRTVFVSDLRQTAPHIWSKKNRLSDWRNNIITDNQEQSATHKDYVLTYLTCRQVLGLLQVL